MYNNKNPLPATNDQAAPLPPGGVGGGPLHRKTKNIVYSDIQRERLLSLRRNATWGERKLWAALRELRQQSGVKFRRQHPIGPYIADFFSHTQNCVIEVDGSSHDSRAVQDKNRDDYMKKLGIIVLRFSEADVCRDVDAVINTIISELNVRLDGPAPNPSRREGS